MFKINTNDFSPESWKDRESERVGVFRGGKGEASHVAVYHFFVVILDIQNAWSRFCVSIFQMR